MSNKKTSHESVQAETKVKNPSMSRKIIPVPLKSENEEITIIAAGDFHLGSDACNKGALKAFVQQVYKESQKHQTYLLLMGDLFDALSMNDRRSRQDERDGSMDENIKRFGEIFDPILCTNRVKIVGSLIGNHELKYNGGDTDPIQRLYEKCHIDHLGIKSFIYFDLNLGKKKLATLRTVAFHGASNSRQPQGQLRIIREFLKENDLTMDDHIRLNQVSFMGHTHACRVEEVIKLIPDPRKGTYRNYTQYACNCGTFHDSANFTTNSYSTAMGYNPAPVGYVKVSVSMEKINAVVVNKGLNPMVSPISWQEI